MRFLFTVLTALISLSSFGQYYFNDILATRQSMDQYQLLRAGKVKKISATSFEEDHSVTDGFLLEQELTVDGKKLITNSANISGKKNQTTSFFEMGKLKKTQSFSNGIDNKMEYAYDDKGRLQLITLTTIDTAMKYKSVETREWHYAANGQISDMLKIKNNKDTTLVQFIYDEAGNPVEEHWKKKNRELETYYYYFNDSKQLTDIVRFNNKLKKLAPDYVFEYDDKGKPVKMTQLSGNGNYLVWEYGYNEKGLKLFEKCMDQNKRFVGSIEYRYNY